ncbi:Uncharacterised protein [Mycobacteroides abscessus subsp. bolletii]|uniref:DUF7432 family protein n=1 Tax=Mycobacteroides abscessus TaxID=36809 RepID=UPI0009A8946E|nr:hypothetical protein [Mycobacteroides abscessus]SKX80359.1 Uncharacterised protein [Mycobacteroides abscessus subsp. bolletii]
MARPESVDDLPDDTRRSLIARIYTEEFVDDPDITASYAEFVRAAAGVGDIEHHGGQVDLYRNKPSEDCNEELTVAQHRWDALARRYEDVRDGDVPKDYERRALRRFAIDEGLPVLPATAEDEAIADLKKELAGN